MIRLLLLLLLLVVARIIYLSVGYSCPRIEAGYKCKGDGTCCKRGQL